jgi:hypothetical protein
VNSFEHCNEFWSSLNGGVFPGQMRNYELLKNVPTLLI